MRIKKIHIQNFKPLVDFQLEDLKPFCAFVGPNASGKSNIFEAIEFTNYVCKFYHSTPSLFGGRDSVLSYYKVPVKDHHYSDFLYFFYEFGDEIKFPIYCRFTNENNKDVRSDSLISIDSDDVVNKVSYYQFSAITIANFSKRNEFIRKWRGDGKFYDYDFEMLIDNFSRVFIGNSKLVRINESSPVKLLPDASNLAQIIGQIFQDENKREDFIEWLRILIPEFENIEALQSNIDGSFEFFIYEKSSNKPFPKYLISDGTYNILSLMAAVYQNSQPQFLCIEEPENGLHPEAIELLVDFFREKCETEGHHIWLNTHSATLVRCLEIDEVILVNKINGQTKAKQQSKIGNVNIKTDEAWLSNALGGGVLWSE